MNETQSWLGTTGTATINTSGYSGNIGMGTSNPNSILTVSHPNSGLTLSGNSTINYSTNQIQNNMTPKQVNVAVFTITRDEDTNEINSTKFLKELWIEQKNGTSIDLLVAKQLGNDFDPELTIIKTLSIVNF
jgi:hypothetical protein